MHFLGGARWIFRWCFGKMIYVMFSYLPRHRMSINFRSTNKATKHFGPIDELLLSMVWPTRHTHIHMHNDVGDYKKQTKTNRKRTSKKKRKKSPVDTKQKKVHSFDVTFHQT